jgi:FtsP/CotA-like multicopper oxidase with cupredoxin domain
LKGKRIVVFAALVSFLIVLGWGIDRNRTSSPQQSGLAAKAAKVKAYPRINWADKKAAAVRFWASYNSKPASQRPRSRVMDPGGVPHYFGPYPNWAYSPMPKGPINSLSYTVVSGGTGYSATPTVTINDLYATGTGATATATVVGGVITAIVPGAVGSNYSAPTVVITDATGTGAVVTAAIGGPFAAGTGIRKFIDSVPGLNPAGVNNLGQYIPVGVPDTTTYPGSDYYEIELRQYTEKMHTDLPPTTLRGYVQVRNGADVAPIHYLGPLVVAQRDRPVRVKFTNKLPTGLGGNLFLPVDESVMGAGVGPDGATKFAQNRGTIHLHGAFAPWISDGTTMQWITPAGEATPYPEGASVANVPDMPDPGPGAMTFFYTNQQSARLMFYHDHAHGLTRLNVYAGEAAGYLLTDQVETDLIAGTNVSGVNPGLARVLPGVGIPLVIQDKTWIDPTTIAEQDPTWNWGATPPAPHAGDLWYPHVYMPAQNPGDPAGMNAFGRWHYGPWFWPPTPVNFPPVPNPYYDPTNAPWEPPQNPGVPNPSMAGEAFMDTLLVNGTVYPYLVVEPKTYRFRILNAADDRFLNLQWYVADPAVVTADGRTLTEVKMVPAAAAAGFPADWPTDGRAGGVPDPATRGPEWVQIGTEGGFLPAPVVVPIQPVTWNLDPTTFNFGNVDLHSLLLGCAERMDVLVDFSAFAGQTLILYNDAPTAFPALIPSYDYYTGAPDQTDVGGVPAIQAGFGPNIRTVMQVRVGTTVSTPFSLDLAGLNAAFASTATKQGVFAKSQDPIIVPEARYNSAYNKTFPADTYIRIFDTSKTFQTLAGTTLSLPLQPKAMQDEMGEAFDVEYGRMSGMLGVEMAGTNAGTQAFVLYPYLAPPSDVVVDSMVPLSPILGDGTQIWKITHNGVDTHPIHFHLFNVQLINRVGWDNGIRPAEDGELGWKETVRVSPLEDTIVALRPYAPTLPFKIPNSVRLINPDKPEGAVLMAPPPVTDEWFDPSGESIVTITNHYVNFGWEYVWHCHILAHEEMDMMHSLLFAVAPDAPTLLTAALVGNTARLTWQDNSITETAFTVQRATAAAGPWTNLASGLPASPGSGSTVTYIDSTLAGGTAYYYRVMAVNVVGDTMVYPAPAVGFPYVTMNSAFSNIANLPPLVSGAQENLLGTWDGQGVYFRSAAGAWTILASPATIIAAGDVFGDGLDDLLGIWNAQGVFARNSASGGWTFLGSNALHISAGDMNGDGRDDLVGTWTGQGAFYRDSVTGVWNQLATDASLVAAGDLDGDGKDDLIAIAPDGNAGVWYRSSINGTWVSLGTAPVDIAAGDMNGDGRADFIGTWAGQGTYYRNSVSGLWVQIATAADQVAAGDLDGDGTDDLIGIWAGQAGVWVKYSQTGTWAYIGSSARDIGAGRFAGGVWAATPLAAPMGGVASGPQGQSVIDLSAFGPGGKNFLFKADLSLGPWSRTNRVPGPGEQGFTPERLRNLVPQKGEKR